MNINVEIQRLRGLTVGQLREELERVSGDPARSNNRGYLIKRIAWRLQAAAEGGLSERAVRRAAELAREGDLRIRPRPEVHAAYARADAASAPATGDLPAPGCVIRKVYKGRHLEVRVLERGFEFEGATYPSLTALAKHITGANWNGRGFFGLTTRGNRT